MATPVTTSDLMDAPVAREARLVIAHPREDEAEARLTTAEKAMFGVAAAFSAVLLAITVMLTVVGFIFSPITHTLVFALLAGATGTTSYVIWRGGRK